MDDSSTINMSEEEKKIRGQLESEVERELEEEIKDGIYHLALRLHRLYRQRKQAGSGNKTVSELNISIKMEGETKIEIKETKKEARPRTRATATATRTTCGSLNDGSTYQYSNWANTLRSGTSPVVHKRNDGSYKARVMSSGRESPRTR